MGEKDHSGINRSRGGSVRGVSQRRINQKRGVKGHVNNITAEDIQAQYAHVGISISQDEAEKIHQGIYVYTGGFYPQMREAYALDAAGKGQELTPIQRELLSRYKMCEEYCKVAPTYNEPGVEMIHRGIKVGSNPEAAAYAARIYKLKPGDSWTNDKMPSSYTSSLKMAEHFAEGRGGIILHAPTRRLKNSISISGLSSSIGENEVLVSDYNWKVSRVRDLRKTSDGHYHVYLK